MGFDGTDGGRFAAGGDDIPHLTHPVEPVEATVILSGLGRRCRGLIRYVLSMLVVLSPILVLIIVVVLFAPVLGIR
jgi:hypothetical protein